MRSTRSIIPWAAALAVSIACLTSMAAPAFAGTPHWQVITRSAPSQLQPGKPGEIVTILVNLGDESVVATEANPVTVTAKLPNEGDGLSDEVVAVEKMAGFSDPGAINGPGGRAMTCTPLPTLKCTFAGQIPPYGSLQMQLPVRAGETFDGGTSEVKIGGPVPTQPAQQVIPRSPELDVTAAAPSGARALNVAGAPATGTTVNLTELNGKTKNGEEAAGLRVGATYFVRALSSDEITLSTSKQNAEESNSIAFTATVGSSTRFGEGTQFGVERYELTPEEEDGATDLQAGSHPFQLTTTLELNQTARTNFAKSPPVEDPAAPALLRNLNTTLPPGLVGNPLEVPTCSATDFSTIRLGTSNTCPGATAVGVAIVTFKEPTFFQWQTEAVPVFNLEPAIGEPARFGFSFDEVPVTLDTAVRTGQGYAVEANVRNASQAAEVLGTTVVIWGVPGEASHDNARGWECLVNGNHVGELKPRPPCNPLGNLHPGAYLTMPTSCSESLPTFVQAQSWVAGAPLLPPVYAPSSALVGCSSLPFSPTLSVTPDEHSASTPSGYTVEVSLPQDTTLAAKGVAEAAVKATELVFPEGVQTNASAANGLETCSVEATGFDGPEGAREPALSSEIEAQLFTSAAASCPDASKIGDVNIKSPLLEHELIGSVYLGGQDTNPFASPLVTYIIAEDPVSGVRVKLAGETRISETGQLTSVFKNTPPVPFETLKLHLTNGARASLTTPPYCRAYESRATFTPWSGEEAAQRSSSFTPEAGPNGTACQSGGPLPFSPTVVGGSNGQAGAFTPFSLTIGHPDGNQPLKEISVQLPEGLAGVLASVPLCPSDAAVAGNCPEASLVGSSTAEAGLGKEPVTLPGKVYLTGPIKGAPFGLLDVTEAKAGPFNLGDVDVLSTITVNETTAAVTVKSDPLPQFVKGVPAQLKELNVTVNRSGFQFNPTNCTPTTIGGTLSGYEGGTSAVSSPFDLANCSKLPFAPKLTASVGAKASKVDGASFHVKITSAGIGQANIHKVELELPEALPSRNTTLQKACLEKVFNANPAGCDEGSVIGEATVHTPVLKNPLSGPAYLVSHGNAAFPDVEFVLQGEGIKLVLDGKTDIKKINGAEVTFSRFESSPDAPFTTFETNFPAGPHSVLTSYVPKDEYNLCAATNLTMPTTIVGQNGAVIEQTTKIVPTGCASSAHKKTSAQKLASALKTCKKLKSKKKRSSCAATARKKYPAAAAAAKKAALKRHARNASKKKR